MAAKSNTPRVNRPQIEKPGAASPPVPHIMTARRAGAVKPSQPSTPADGLEHQGAIDLLKAIATASYDSLLMADRPPHPDHVLLDVVSDALHHIKLGKELRCQAWHVIESTRFGSPERAQSQSLFGLSLESGKTARALILRAGKLKATTAAGIYAKCLLVRSAACSAKLGQSLADELLACQAIRESLWPAGQP